MITILQMRELRPRTIKTLAQGLVASKENHQDSRAESSYRICAVNDSWSQAELSLSKLYPEFVAKVYQNVFKH